LSFWKPKASSIEVFVSYVTNAHGFFIKNGYEFYDFFNEEAKKTIFRPKLGKVKKDQNGASSVDSGDKNEVEVNKADSDEIMQEVTDAENQLASPAEQFHSDSHMELETQPDTQPEPYPEPKDAMSITD
jgi:hypothetical protein